MSNKAKIIRFPVRVQENALKKEIEKVRRQIDIANQIAGNDDLRCFRQKFYALSPDEQTALIEDFINHREVVRRW